jgi:hypothetical protein
MHNQIQFAGLIDTDLRARLPGGLAHPIFADESNAFVFQERKETHEKFGGRDEF